MALETRRGRLHFGQAAADLAEFGGIPHRHHRRPAPTAGHQRAGPQQIAWLLASHRQRFPRQQRFIQPQAHTLQQLRIAGHPVTLLEPQLIPRT